MHKSRLIRFAVNLCAIGALLLPHAGLRWSSAKACGAGVASVAKCAGCGHCEVAKFGDQCRCCCPKHATHLAKSQSAAGKALGQRRATESVVREEMPDAGHGICMCDRDSEPAVPPPPSRTGAEQLVLALLASPATDIVAIPDAARAANSEQGWVPSFLSPRDSQRRFCVWLI